MSKTTKTLTRRLMVNRTGSGQYVWTVFDNRLKKGFRLFNSSDLTLFDRFQSGELTADEMRWIINAARL